MKYSNFFNIEILKNIMLSDVYLLFMKSDILKIYFLVLKSRIFPNKHNMNKNVLKAKRLMQERLKTNKAPSELLIELAVKKWQELSRKYKANEDIVSISLYLAHTIFSPEWWSDIQKNHPELSANFVKPCFDNWKVNQEDQNTILNAIRAHHNDEPCESLEAEVMKNAECFKFVSLEWSLIWFHELWLRRIAYNQSKEKVIKKMQQKLELLTLDDCILEAKHGCVKIEEIFS